MNKKKALLVNITEFITDLSPNSDDDLDESDDDEGNQPTRQRPDG